MKFCFVYLFLFTGLLVGGQNIEVLKPRLMTAGQILLKRADMVQFQMIMHREPEAERSVIRKEATMMAQLMSQLEVPSQGNITNTIVKLYHVECNLNKRLKAYVAAQIQKSFFLKSIL